MQIISCLILNCSHLQVRSSCCRTQTHSANSTNIVQQLLHDMWNRMVAAFRVIWWFELPCSVQMLNLNSISQYVKQKHFKKRLQKWQKYTKRRRRRQRTSNNFWRHSSRRRRRLRQRPVSCIYSVQCFSFCTFRFRKKNNDINWVRHCKA